MDEKKISELNPIGTVDRTTDYIPIVDASATETMRGTVNTVLGFTAGNPVSTTDSQTLTNKTLTSPVINTPTLTVLDSGLTLQDNADTSKQAQFQLSGITTATTRTYTLPNRSDTLVDLGSTQTLTSKTLTAPTITNPTLTIDTISEFTSSNGVTIDGLNIKDSAINTNNSVPNTALSNTGAFSSNWAWTSWTPTFANFTKGSATITAKYVQIGKVVHYKLTVVLSSSTMGTIPTFTLPITSVTMNTNDQIGYGQILDSGTGSYNAYAQWATTTTATLKYYTTTGNNITATQPMTWANNDTFSIQGEYEAA